MHCAAMLCAFLFLLYADQWSLYVALSPHFLRSSFLFNIGACALARTRIECDKMINFSINRKTMLTVQTKTEKKNM